MESVRRQLEQRQRDLNELQIAWRDLQTLTAGDLGEQNSEAISSLTSRVSAVEGGVASLAISLALLEGDVANLKARQRIAIFEGTSPLSIPVPGPFSGSISTTSIPAAVQAVIPVVRTSSVATAMVTVRVPTITSTDFTFEVIASAATDSILDFVVIFLGE